MKKRRGKLLGENQVLHLFVQISLAIKHTHDRKILHRDLKTQNIFLTSSGIVKLGDFGIARVLRNTGELAATRIGTPYYMSPEVMDNKRYNNKTDIWSLGCILYELMALKVPFDGQSMRQLVYNIMYSQPSPVNNGYSSDLRELYKVMLMKDPRQRPSVNKVLSKPVVRQRISTILNPTEEKDEFSHTILHGLDIMRAKQAAKLQPPPAGGCVSKPPEPVKEQPQVTPAPQRVVQQVPSNPTPYAPSRAPQVIGQGVKPPSRNPSSNVRAGGGIRELIERQKEQQNQLQQQLARLQRESVKGRYGHNPRSHAAIMAQYKNAVNPSMGDQKAVDAQSLQQKLAAEQARQAQKQKEDELRQQKEFQEERLRAQKERQLKLQKQHDELLAEQRKQKQDAEAQQFAQLQQQREKMVREQEKQRMIDIQRREQARAVQAARYKAARQKAKAYDKPWEKNMKRPCGEGGAVAAERAAEKAYYENLKKNEERQHGKYVDGAVLRRREVPISPSHVPLRVPTGQDMPARKPSPKPEWVGVGIAPARKESASMDELGALLPPPPPCVNSNPPRTAAGIVPKSSNSPANANGEWFNDLQSKMGNLKADMEAISNSKNSSPVPPSPSSAHHLSPPAALSDEDVIRQQRAIEQRGVNEPRDKRSDLQEHMRVKREALANKRRAQGLDEVSCGNAIAFEDPPVPPGPEVGAVNKIPNKKYEAIPSSKVNHANRLPPQPPSARVSVHAPASAEDKVKLMRKKREEERKALREMIAQKRKEQQVMKQQRDWDDDHSDDSEEDHPKGNPASGSAETNPGCDSEREQDDLSSEETELLATVKESERLKTLIIGEVLKSAGVEETLDDGEEDRLDLLMSTLNRAIETDADEVDAVRMHTAKLLSVNNDSNAELSNSAIESSDDESEAPAYAEVEAPNEIENNESYSLEYSKMLSDMKLVLDMPCSKPSSASTTKTTNSNSNSEENAVDAVGENNEEEEDDDFFEEESPVASDASDSSGFSSDVASEHDDLLDGLDIEDENGTDTSQYFDCEEISEDLISTRKAEADNAEILLNEYEHMMEVQLKKKQSELQRAIHNDTLVDVNADSNTDNDPESSVELEKPPAAAKTSISYLNETTTGAHLSSIASSKELIKKKRLELEILELKHELLLLFSEGKLQRACELLITIDHNDDHDDDKLLSGIEKMLGVNGLQHLDELFKLITLQAQYDAL